MKDFLNNLFVLNERAEERVYASVEPFKHSVCVRQAESVMKMYSLPMQCR